MSAPTPPQAPPGIDPVSQLAAILQSDPELAPLAQAFAQLMQEDYEAAQKLAQMPVEQALQVLAEMAYAMTGEPNVFVGGDQGGQNGPTEPVSPAVAPVSGGLPGGLPPSDALGNAQPVAPAPQAAMPPMTGAPEPMTGAPEPPAGQLPPEAMVQPNGPPGGPANSAPGSMQELLADLDPGLSKLVRGLSRPQQEQVLQVYREKGLAMVENLLRQVQAAARGAEKGPTGALQRQRDGETGDPGQGPTGRPKKRAKTTPSFELRDLPPNRWGGKGPSYATVKRHLTQAKDLWKPRDLRIEEDIRLYQLSRDRTEIPTGPNPAKPVNPLQGDIIHVSSRPFQLVERVTSYTSATGPRKPTIDCPPWSDDDETINASQAMEDWLSYSRDRDERSWMRRGANGDPRPPLPRVEAGGMTLLGGAGFRVTFDPTDPTDPIACEYIPINRLYPLPGVAMIYAETMTLAEARTHWPEINDYYPPEDEDKDGGKPGPPPNTTITVGAWTDVYPKGQGGLWHGIFWVSGDTGGWGDAVEQQRAKWIKPMTRVDFGFSPYQYVVWGGATYYATDGMSDYNRFRGMGVLTPLRRTFKLLDLLWSAIATQALKAVDPALVQYYQPGTRKEDMFRYKTRPGSTNYAIVGEKVEPLIWSISGVPDGQAILRALYEEISDADNPIMTGGGNAQSGVQQSIQAASANYLSVNPIMDALEQYYQLQNELKAELLIRKGGEGEIGKLPYPARAADDQFDAVWPTMKTLTPEIAKLNGTTSVVTYQRLSLVEQQLLWNMIAQAVQSKMLAARDGMKRMGVANPQRNLLRILQETAVMNPKALEAMTGAAIMGGGNELFQIGWQQVLMGAGQGGQGGSPPAERGVPSAVGPQQLSGGPQGQVPQGNGGGIPVLG